MLSSLMLIKLTLIFITFTIQQEPSSGQEIQNEEGQHFKMHGIKASQTQYDTEWQFMVQLRIWKTNEQPHRHLVRSVCFCQ